MVSSDPFHGQDIQITRVTESSPLTHPSLTSVRVSDWPQAMEASSALIQVEDVDFNTVRGNGHDLSTELLFFGIISHW